MSEGSRLFPKPKVRFSQSIQNLDNLSDKRTFVKKDLPKVKSVTSIKIPVKLCNFKKQLDKAITTNTFPINEIVKKDSVIYDNMQPLSMKDNNYSLKDHLIRVADNEESLNNLCNIEIPKVNRMKYASTDGKQFKETMESKCYDGKENKNLYMKKTTKFITNEKVIKPSCLKRTSCIKEHIKRKANVMEVNVQTSSFINKHDVKNSNKPSILNIERQVQKTVDTFIKYPRKNARVQSTTVNVMPCYKYRKVMPKNKISPVKKSIVRDIIVSNVKTYIGSDMEKKKLDDFDVHQINEDINMRSSIISSQKLLQPEYNSILCTTTKLNDVKKEKIVRDIEHLPLTYRKLVNGKTSIALDFPLNEVIYKDLISLSINEKQFPCKIMRSRDPQPRQKDIVPKLSDFFIPESIKEYYTSMYVKPKSLNIIENWNAFQVSDKICKWKDNVK